MYLFSFNNLARIGSLCVILLLVALTVPTSVAEGSTDLNSIIYRLHAGMEPDDKTRNPAALLLADVELSFLDTAFRPSLGLGLSAQGREHFNVSPTWTAALHYRFEITQWVPFLYARCFGNLRDDWWHRGSVGLGLDRLYQGGYQISFITGPTMRFNQNPRVGVLVLLSIGYQDTYNELY